MRLWAIGGAGAGAMLAGAAMVARSVGATEIEAIASAPVAAPNTAMFGFVLLALPLLAAAGAAPLHGWAAPALGRNRDFIATTLGALSVIGAISVLARLAAYAELAPAIASGLSAVLVALGAVSVAYGAVQAVGATNVRRLVAYAGAMQVGCILIALALGSPAGFAAALLQIVAWAAASLALLTGAAAAKDAQFASFDGLVRRAPVASIAVTMGALSFMGAPLTLGFLGRWRLIEASVGAGWWWATGATIVASLAAVFFGGRLIERVYFRRATTTSEIDRDGWRWTRAAVGLAAIATIALGVAPELLLQAAARAAELALGHAP
jgi:multicomponent Na+:H+ antiporter subunit D